MKDVGLTDFHYIQFAQIIVTDLMKSSQKVWKWKCSDMFSNVEVGGVNSHLARSFDILIDYQT